MEFWRGILKRGRCARSERARKRTGAYFESLESRVLLSGGVEGALADTYLLGHQDFAQAPVAAEIAFVEQAQETALLDLSGLAESDPEVQPDLMDGAGMREIVFVDENVSDYERLIADLQQADDHRNIEVAVLESDRNGIEQVSEILADRSDLTAVHFITHGADGQIDLGNTWLNSATLKNYSAMVSGWGNALSETGDILFYGCNIAAASDGQSLLDYIAELTAADVAASEDLSGSRLLGGDWELEFIAGAIETTGAFTEQAQQDWAGLLANLTVDTTNDVVDGTTTSIANLLANKGADGKISLREAIIVTNNTAGADAIVLGAGTYTLSLTGAGENSAASGDLDITDDLTLTGAGAMTTSIDGADADRVFEVSGATVTMSGLTIRNGSAVDGGGFRVDGAGSLTLRDAAITNNHAMSSGGGILVSGGLIMDRVTIEGNSAALGGGVYVNNAAGATFVNATLSGNTVVSNGGAIFTRNTIDITNSTIAYNTAAGAGGIHKQGSGTANVKNTILANNTGGNSSGALNSLGNNIDDDGTAGLSGEGDLSINALLDPTLRDNGGPTLTHALLLGSPAINAGTNTGAPPVDQRGFPRSDGSTDIGAYESYESGTAPAPGGVTSQLKLWLKADAGVTQSGTVSRWDNQVANATLPFVQQATASDRPQYSPSAVNFHPAITFDGVNDDLRDDSVLGSDLFVSDAASIFTVVRTTSNVIIQWLDTLSNRVSLEGGAPRFDFGDLLADRLDGIGTSPGYHIVNAQAAPGTPANLAIYVDGSLNNSKSASSGNPLDPTPTGLLRLGEYPGGGYNAAMDLAEVVIYQSNLSAADRLKVESYLAVKYGLTLNQAAPTSYVASDGTVIWDAALNAGYNNDIAGTGRDDASSLAQTQSRSINSDAIVTLSSASDQNNDEFLLWGNDNGALTETAVGNPAGVLQRLQRIWRVDETGDVGTTTMKLDVNSLPVTGTTVGDFKLIVDSDTDFTSGATLLSASSYVGGIVTFNGVNLADGAYFALATDFCQPPVLATIEGLPLTYTENDPATAITATITAGDQDDANLAGATIQITGNYVSGQDVLSFTNTASITGAWNAVTGKLTLSGTDTVANYQAALRAVKYQNTSEDPSAGTRTLGFQVNDGTADSNLLTRDITVTSVNDPPVDTIPGAQNTAMNTAVVFSAANGNLISTGDIDAGTNPLEVTLTAADGTLTLNGTSGLNFSLGDGSADPTMTFTGTAADINTALDGLRYDPPPGYSGSTTLAITTNDQGYVGAGGPQSGVSAVIINVAFTNTAPTLSGANDLTTIDEDPVANPGTLVSDLITGMVSDPDAGAIFGIAVTAVDNTNGVWQYTTDGGGAWVDFGSPSETAARLLAGDASTLVRFVPDSNWNGTVTSGITFRAWDRTSGAAGDTADVTTTGGTTAFSTATDTASLVVNAVNDAPVITSASLTVSEGQTVTLSGANFGITDPDDGSFTYTLSGISGGYFQLSSAPGTPITTFTSADLAGNLVQFVDDGDEVAPAFSVTVNDGDVDSNTLAATISYTPVNDVPVVTGASLTVSEGQTVTLAPANFGITDPDDGSFTYTVSGIAGGYFELSSAPGTPITTFTSADLTANLVQFVDDGNEVAPAFSVTVNDGDIDSNTLAATVTYTAVNDAPVITSATLSVNEGQTVTLGGANFAITDPDDGSFTYTVSGISGGYFQLSSAAGTPITTFTSADLTANLVQFVDDGNEVAPAFSVTVNDGDVDSNTLAATITYTPVNDVPVVTGASLTVSEGQTVTLAPASFGITDPDGGSFTYTVSGIAGGYFRLSSAPGTPITTFTSADLAGNLVQFVDDGNEVAPAFSVTVNDGDIDSNTLPATVTYTPVNDAPAVTTASLTISEGQTVTLSGANFGITDPDDGSFTYTVSGIAGGYFQLSSAPGTPITAFTSADLTASLVQFVDDGNEVAPAFSVTVNDGDADSNTLAATITYTPVNDAPAVTTASLTVSEGQTVTLAHANFGITDPDDGSFTYTVSAVSGGYFQLSSAPGTPITTFTSADLAGNLVQFVDDGNEVAPAFSVTVNDGDADSNTLAATVTYTPVNDVPVVTSASLTLSEGQTVTLSGANFGITDPDDGSFTYTVSGISGGYFQLSSSPGTPITSFTSADLSGGLVQLVDDGDEVAPGFSVTVNDGDIDSNTLAATVTYTAVNDAPVITSATLSVNEGQTVTLGGANFAITDPDDGSFTYTVSGISGGYFQLSSAAGTPITTFTSADLAASLVQFVDDGDEVAPAFSVTVNDGDVDSNTLAATISYTPVNDVPVVTGASLTISEGQTVTLSGANFGITDPDDGSFTYTVSAVSGGYFHLSTSPGTPITTFSSADLSGNLVQFVDDGDEVAPAFSVTVNDGDADSNTLAATISYTPANDVPVVTSASLTLSEGQTVTLSGANFGITDPDDASFTYTVSGISGGYFQLSSAPGTPITTFTSADLTASLVQFVDDGNEVAPAFSVTVNDGDADSNTLAATVTYTPVNDTPVNSVPGVQGTAEDTPLVFSNGNGNLISISDLDAGANPVQVTLTASNGTLSLAGIGGLAFTVGDGTDDTSMTFTGSMANINAALDGLTFTPSTGFSGGAAVQISTNDQGNSGSGGPLTDTDTVNINVSNVNNPPSATNLSAPETYTEDTPLGLTDIVVADAESPNVTVILTLSDSAAGSLSTATSGAVTSTYNAGTGVWTASGPDADVNTLLAGVVFNPATNYNNSFTIATSVDDGTAAPINGMKNVTGTPVNDAPTGSVTISGTPAEDQTLTASNTLADADGMGVVSYQWQRDGVNIAGATNPTYTLTDADVGTTLTVVAAYTDGQGTNESVSSAGVGPIANVNDAPVGVPVITGTVTEDQVLTADTSGISDADGLGAFSYQWQRSTDGGSTWTSITGATGSTYILGDADVGNVLRVNVSYTDGHGMVESVTSAQTAAVGPVTNVSDPGTVVIDNIVDPVAVTDNINPITVDIDNPTDVVEPQTVPSDNQSSPLPEHTEPSPNSAGGGSVPKETQKEASPQADIPGESDLTPDQPSAKKEAPSGPRVKKDLPSLLLPKLSLPNAAAAGDKLSAAVQKQDLRAERPFSVMRASDYEHLRDSLDAVKEEMTSETRLGKVYLGSAIISSIGLSVGYVVWLLRGGMLLASLLSSVPAWQFLDPLPILARKKDDDDSDDNESLESIVDKKPEQINPKKRTADAAADAEVKGP